MPELNLPDKKGDQKPSLMDRAKRLDRKIDELRGVNPIGFDDLMKKLDDPGMRIIAREMGLAPLLDAYNEHRREKAKTDAPEETTEAQEKSPEDIEFEEIGQERRKIMAENSQRIGMAMMGSQGGQELIRIFGVDKYFEGLQGLRGLDWDEQNMLELIRELQPDHAKRQKVFARMEELISEEEERANQSKAPDREFDIDAGPSRASIHARRLRLSAYKLLDSEKITDMFGRGPSEDFVKMIGSNFFQNVVNAPEKQFNQLQTELNQASGDLNQMVKAKDADIRAKEDALREKAYQLADKLKEQVRQIEQKITAEFLEKEAQKLGQALEAHPEAMDLGGDQAAMESFLQESQKLSDIRDKNIGVATADLNQRISTLESIRFY